MSLFYLDELLMSLRRLDQAQLSRWAGRVDRQPFHFRGFEEKGEHEYIPIVPRVTVNNANLHRDQVASFTAVGLC